MRLLSTLVTGLAGFVFVVMLLCQAWWLLFPALAMPPLLGLLCLLGVLWIGLCSGLFKAFEFYKFRGRYASQLNLFHQAPRAWVILLFVPYWGVLLGFMFLRIVGAGALLSAFFVYASLALLLYSHYSFPVVVTHQRPK